MPGIEESSVKHIKLGLLLNPSDSSVNIRLIHVDSGKSFTFYKDEQIDMNGFFDWGDDSGGLDNLLYFDDFGNLPISDYDPTDLPASLAETYYSLEGSFDEVF